MKLIESKAELLLQPDGLEGVYKQIEICGRTCYKSLDKMTEDSAKAFVERMIASNHTAMLEQGTIYLMIPLDYKAKYEGDNYAGGTRINFVEKCPYYETNSYSKSFVIHLNSDMKYPNVPYGYNFKGGIKYQIVTTNFRVLQENNWLDDLKYICKPTKYHEKRYTIKFITDRGVSHELVRHRVFSFAQESTRYCNYSKDKFGNEITFIIPSWSGLQEGVLEYSPLEITPKDAEFMQSCFEAEKHYLQMIEYQASPQEARQVLPNAVKTEVCMTGFASDWRFFFDLRYYGETGKPHPDMELVASKARTEFMKAGLWDDIMSYPSKFGK